MAEIEKIDVNLAEREVLSLLPGVGEALADRIIQYRETVHPFAEVIELTAVPGISERMVRAFADQVVVNSISEDNEWQMMHESEEQETTMPETDPTITPETTTTVTTNKPTAPEDTPAVSAAETADLPDSAEAINISASAPEPRPQPPVARSASTPTRQQTPPPTPPSASPAISQRRGCVFVILSAVLGAMLGSALTLALLTAINDGNLIYASSNRTQIDLRDVRSSVAENAATQAAANVGLDNQVATLVPRLDIAATQQAILVQTMTAVQSNLDDSTEIVTSLQATTVALDERMTSLADAAANFDLFLDGLRDLLFALQGTPPPLSPVPTTVSITVTPTLLPTATPTAMTTTQTPTVRGTAVSPTPATAMPTRTPRPTATPLVQPTNQPSPQPEP